MDERDWLLKIGQKIGGCVVVAPGLLGKGGMGQVFLARHIGLDQLRAVKVAVPDPSREGSVDRFIQEARLAARLHHPNVVTIHDAGQESGLYYLVMHLVHGKDLKELLEAAQGPLPWRSVLRIIQLAAYGLQAVHEQELVHRDIKPSNIMLAKDHGVYLMDFGLVREEIDLLATRTESIEGTVPYMSPEQCDGKGITHLSDIFSLGSTLYHLITNEFPFPGKNVKEVMQRITSGIPPAPVQRFNSEVPASVSLLLAKAIASDPRRRFQTARAMAASLRDIIVGNSVDVPKDSSRRHEPAPPARERPKGLQPERAFDENVQFAVYRPKTVRPEEFYPMVAAAHLDKKRPGAPPDEPQPAEKVRRIAERILREEIHDYGAMVQDSLGAIPRGGEITFVPEMDGVSFTPPRHTLVWQDDQHTVVFLMKAARWLEYKVARGKMSVFYGPFLLGVVPLRIAVDSAWVCPVGEPDTESVSVPRYRKIFVSCSPKDAPIVEEFERFVESLGDQYLRDVRLLRCGDRWSDTVAQKIAEADVFQLFWSRNSMRSRLVQQEWEYALSLKRKGEGFVRPVYWEDPFPEDPPHLPPEELRRIPFHRLRGESPPHVAGLPGGARAGEGFSAGDWAAEAGGAAPRSVPMGELLPLLSRADRVRSKARWAGGAVVGVAAFALLVWVAMIGGNNHPPPIPPANTANMVSIEPGYVQLGDDPGKLRKFFTSRPECAKMRAAEIEGALKALAAEQQERVFVPGFYIDRYEVTNAEYAEFVAATSWPPPSLWHGATPPIGRENNPVTDVRYSDAEAYARWKGKKLPTREQWMRAYRGDHDWLFPWGDDYDASRANVGDNKKFPYLSPVAETPQDVTASNVFNMVGNATEYVRGVLQYEGRTWRVLKGAAYNRPGFRYGIGSGRLIQGLNDTAENAGFRCIVEDPSRGAAARD